MPTFPPSAGIPGPLTERLIFAAQCEVFRAARRAGLSIEEAAGEADAVARRAAALWPGFLESRFRDTSRMLDPSREQEAGGQCMPPAGHGTQLARAGTRHDGPGHFCRTAATSGTGRT